MQNKRLFGIRGAVCCENTESGVLQAVDRLAIRLFAENALQADDIVSIQFTVTNDITALNPASALRKSSVKTIASRCALFCAAEPNIVGALPRVIRVLVTAYMPETTSARHIYIDGAEVLRPDITDKSCCVISREYEGIAEAGGVKTVVRSLSEELASCGIQTTLFMPLYTFSNTACLENYRENAFPPLSVTIGEQSYSFTFAAGTLCGVEFIFPVHQIFLDCHAVYTYTPKDENQNSTHIHGTGFHNAQLINLLLQKVVIAFYTENRRAPQLMHCHDATTSLIPALALAIPQNAPYFASTSFAVSIHNAGPGYHHEFYSLDEAVYFTGIERNILAASMNGSRVEPYLLAARYASMSTVSPWYAAELSAPQTPDNSDGLAACFAANRTEIVGITNGINPESYDTTQPSVSLLPYPFNPSTSDFDGKYRCRQFLLDALNNIPKNTESNETNPFDEVTVFGSINSDNTTPVHSEIFLAHHGRIVRQKGIDVLIDALELLLSENLPVRFAISGQGENYLEKRLISLTEKFPGKGVYFRGYNKMVSRLCTAISDFLILPSDFEPCGLEDFIGQLFGTIPVAHATGGLNKILHDKTGFLYAENTPQELATLLRSLITDFAKNTAHYREIACFAARYVHDKYSWKYIVKNEYFPFYQKCQNAGKLV